MNANFKKEYYLLGLSCLGVILAIIFSLLIHWEMGGETWGYWFFARVFGETGKFIISGRCPLYILYLNIFYWLGYPTSVTIEYIVTTTIASVALILFLKKHMGLGWATFAAILWIPFLQWAEPPVQKLALACSLFAIIVRQSENNRLKIMISYGLLFLACMFRMSYVVLIPLFGVYDLIRLIKVGGKVSWFPHLRSDWPLIIITVLLLWFSVMQSPHPWNNAWLATTKWYPSDGKSLSSASFVQNFNWAYIDEKYKSFEKKDFYFTNHELFGGRSNIIEAYGYAPGVIVKQIARNTMNLFSATLVLTEFDRINQSPDSKSLFKVFYWISTFIAFLFILTGAFYAAGKDKLVILLIAGSVLICLTNVLSMTKVRYLIPLIPILSLSAYGYAERINKAFTSLNKGLILAIMLVLFSNGTTKWMTFASDLAGDLSKNEIHVLENRPFSMKASYRQLKLVAKQKNGILLLENAFVGAFLNTPLQNVYDIWEIPPFGQYGNSVYGGLTPDRIDCVFVSNELATGYGCATNYHIRYQNYIKPYVNKMIANGAKYQIVPHYGYVCFIENSRSRIKVKQ